ncbi:flavin-containing monooxygenase [Solwaraspora sp. WMMB335]|uniref:flavin-containing monooxygenase n=1 Tax=Solwaraspora sp. WMMB335 TaxID=3404118 RepID=UPI003B96266B
MTEPASGDVPRYCVIGAGAAGLAALQVLTAQGFAVECFERGENVGGQWHQTYDSLHLISSRNVSGFLKFPMPSDLPVYPSRAQMCAYITSFADRFGLRRHIRFGSEVTSVTPEGPQGRDGWWVGTSDGLRRRFDGVLVANGHFWDPHLPKDAADFAGRSLHSSQYRGPADIVGQRVLVVGAGNSGCDLAVDMVNARLDVSISIRQGRVFQPKAFFGRSRSEIAWLARLPPRIQERVMRVLVHIVAGPPEAYPGLPLPLTRNLNDQPPVLNTLLLYWIQHGRIEVVPAIDRIEEQTVRFTDGTARDFDTILWATGYRITLPFLDSTLLRWADGVPLRVAGMTVPVGLQRLYFIGLADPRGPQLPVFGQQTRLVARLLRLTERNGLPVDAFHRQVPETRMEVVRGEWMSQMKATTRLVDRLEKQLGG